MKIRTGQSLVAIAVIAFAGCATNMQIDRATNPPPKEAFSAFNDFELKPVALAPEFAGSSANTKATAKIQEHFDNRIRPLVASWKKRTAKGRTLVIEPTIERVKFIGGAARVFAGPLAGGSAVAMKVRYTDKATGRLVAEPEFYQHAGAWAGAFTLGAQDNIMLSRIVTVIHDYNTANYTKAVGGRTGLEDAPVGPDDKDPYVKVEEKAKTAK